MSAEQPVVYTSKASSLRLKIDQESNDLKKAVKKRDHAKVKTLKKSIREKQKQAKKFDKLFTKKCKNGDMACNCRSATFRDWLNRVEVKRFEYSTKCPWDHVHYFSTYRDPKLTMFEELVTEKPKPKSKSEFAVQFEDFSEGN